ICDRDAKWSVAVRERLEEAGIRVVRTPYEAPNANAHAERFVRSMKEECLDRIIPIGEGHFRRAMSEFVAHYIARGIIKVWRTRSLRAHQRAVPAECTASHGSVDCSITTGAQPDQLLIASAERRDITRCRRARRFHANPRAGRKTHHQLRPGS